MSAQKYRLVTRSDFDGLVCAVLLNELDLIDDIKFVHPKDMQDGKIAIGPRDITTNLPYVSGAHLVFDHHLSETIRNAGGQPNHIIDPSPFLLLFSFLLQCWYEMVSIFQTLANCDKSKHHSFLNA